MGIPDENHLLDIDWRDRRISELEEALRGALYMTPCSNRKSTPSDCYQVMVPGTTVNNWRRLLGLNQ